MSSELFEAIEKHDLNRIAELLTQGADPNASRTEWPQFTALQAAINELEDGGSIEALAHLLRHGAAVDRWDSEHDATPLLMAVFRGQREAARMLLDAGADPNVRGGEGDSALRWCAEHNDLEMTELLLRHGAAATINDCGEPRGLTALGVAAEKLNIPMMKLLLDAGASPDARDLDYLTARERIPPRETSDPGTRVAALELLARPKT